MYANYYFVVHFVQGNYPVLVLYFQVFLQCGMLH
jgi:hypothetical protein